ncbi:hypothetical protein JKP88DRAFT_183984 [Tribonema minus]|uniref:DUF1349 domain-containing protein n=1 Tax=Tribonema minus TaxID=303371 RepID=A0A836CPJ2_9STRA|nr:hypothetical protein JKP88DRAFT_183984 [Tribonema minus]
MQWLNEPKEWSQTGSSISFQTQADTDFWRKTHHDFIKDDGHFYHTSISGDFTAEVKVSGDYNALYDQAGLILRLNETQWMKTGIEYVKGVQHASVVITREFSDWSILALNPAPPALWLKVKRAGNAVQVFYATSEPTADGDYTLMRQGYFPTDETVQVGVMACSPKGEGFQARFEDFKVTPVSEGGV